MGRLRTKEKNFFRSRFRRTKTQMPLLLGINQIFCIYKTPADQRDIFLPQTVLLRHNFEAQKQPMHYEHEKKKRKVYSIGIITQKNQIHKLK